MKAYEILKYSKQLYTQDFLLEVKIKYGKDLYKNPEAFQNVVSTLLFFALDKKKLLSVPITFQDRFYEYFEFFPRRILDRKMFIAKSVEFLRRSINAYRNRNTFELGLLYGFPICDVMYYEENKGSQNLINVMFFAIKHPTSPFVHIPCNPNCKETLRIGKKLYSKIKIKDLKYYLKEQTKLYHLITLLDNLRFVKRYKI